MPDFSRLSQSLDSLIDKLHRVEQAGIAAIVLGTIIAFALTFIIPGAIIASAYLRRPSYKNENVHIVPVNYGKEMNHNE